MTTHSIRQLHESDVELYKSIRKDMLEKEANAFGRTFEEELANPSVFFNQRLNESDVFGYFIDDNLAGMTGCAYHESPKKDHKVFLWGVYVRPEYRGHGIFKKIVKEITDNLPDHIEKINLSVASDNHHAHNIYKELGFEEYGVEKRSFKNGETYYDEIFMVKFLK